MLVHESQVEDILATYPAIARRVLNVEDDLRLIVRQMQLPSGRLDLLFARGTSLLLVELKVEPAVDAFVWQLKRYEADLLELKEKGELLRAPIECILLAPTFSTSTLLLCPEQGITPVTFDLEQVLSDFLSQLPAITKFLQIKPKDYGLWNRHLIHRVLYAVERAPHANQVAALTGLSPRSVMNHLRFSIDLHLVSRSGNQYGLTELGLRYVLARASDMPPSEVSDEQLAILRDYIAKHPFGSPVFFGIYAVVDAVFTLARNMYPVGDELMTDYFRRNVGKLFDWKIPRSARQGLRMYSNYAMELGLLARIGQDLFLTPDGLRWILLLNLHKSIQMIDALGVTSEGRTR